MYDAKYSCLIKPVARKLVSRFEVLLNKPSKDSPPSQSFFFILSAQSWHSKKEFNAAKFIRLNLKSKTRKLFVCQLQWKSSKINVKPTYSLIYKKNIFHPLGGSIASYNAP